MTPLRTLFRRLLPSAALVAALFVAGCGIKGPLELPDSANVSENDDKGSLAPPTKTTLPGYYDISAKDRKTQRQLGNAKKPDEPFVLDPLIN